jgi:hypothetical protein
VANQFAQMPVEDARKKFLAAWWTEARKMLRATLAEKGIHLEPKAFEQVFNKWVTQNGGADAINAQISQKFDNDLAAAKTDVQRKVAENLQEQENELHGACRMDVANQVLRAVIVPAVTLVPNIVVGNFAAAKNEPDPVSQAVHAITGVSIPDIFKYGPLGGPTSEPNKILQGIRDGGLLGGKDSFFRKNLGLPW